MPTYKVTIIIVITIITISGGVYVSVIVLMAMFYEIPSYYIHQPNQCDKKYNMKFY